MPKPAAARGGGPPRQFAMDELSLTVQLPFRGAVAARAQGAATVRALCDAVLSAQPPPPAPPRPVPLVRAAPPAGPPGPQCVVFQGRVLPDDVTLRDAGVRDGAVVHVMRRPPAPAPAPAPAPRAEPARHREDVVEEVEFSVVLGQIGEGGAPGHPDPGMIMSLLSGMRGGPPGAPGPPHGGDAPRPAQGVRHRVEHRREGPDSESAVRQQQRRPGVPPSSVRTNDEREQRDHRQGQHSHDQYHHDRDRDRDRNRSRNRDQNRGHEDDDDRGRHQDYEHVLDHDHDHDNHRNHDHEHDRDDDLDHDRDHDRERDRDSDHDRDQDRDHDSDRDGGRDRDPGNAESPDRDHEHVHSHTHNFAVGNGEASQSVLTQTTSQTNMFFLHRDGDSNPTYTDTYDTVTYVLNALGFNASARHRAATLAAATAVSTQTDDERPSASLTILEHAWAEARRTQELVLQASGPAEDVAGSVPPVMPVAPPGADSAQISAGRAGARTLVPALAQMLRSVANEIDNFDLEELFENDTRRQTEGFIERMGALGSLLASTTALIYSVLPGESASGDRGEPEMGRNQRTNLSGHDGSHSPPEQGSTLLDTNSSNSNGPETSNNGPEASQARVDSPPGPSRRDTGQADAVTHARLSPRGTGGRPPQRLAERHHPPSSEGLRAWEFRPRPEEEQKANRDFAVRVLAYYLYSFTEHEIPLEAGPLAGDSFATADSVLDDLIEGERLCPAEGVLRILQTFMQAITPRQFHDMARGNFTVLNSVDVKFWVLAREMLLGSDARTVSEDEAVKAFVDGLCEAIHRFLRMMEHVSENLRGYPASYHDGDNGNSNLCPGFMCVVIEKVSELATLLLNQDDNPMFGEEAAYLLRVTVAQACSAFRSSFQTRWRSVLRSALGNVCRAVFGNNFSVIFPVVMNLYVARAELSARQFEEDPQSFRTEVARFCGVRRPEEPGSRSAGVPHQGMHNRGSVHQAGEGADTALEDYDLPELVDADATAEEDDTWDDQEEYITDSEMNASQELEGDREDDGVTDADATAEEDDTRDDQEEYVTDSEMNTSQELEGDREDDGDIDLDSGHADGSEHVSIYRTGASQDFSEMDLTNDDLEELAVDLEREHTELSKEDDVMIAELDDIAKELEREQSEGDLSLTEKPTRVTRAGSSAKRTAAMSSAFASSLAGPGLAAGLSSSRIANSAINRPAFSTASSARRSSGPPAGRPKDEFEQVLGMDRGALWRDALRGDDARMHAAVHGPLSRGYRNETTPVAELTGKSAVDMGLEDVRAACKEAQLSDAVTQDVEDALRGNGPLYQIELENALRSRLRTDPDYEPDKFPATARRFGGSL